MTDGSWQEFEAGPAEHLDVVAAVAHRKRYKKRGAVCSDLF